MKIICDKDEFADAIRACASFEDTYECNACIIRKFIPYDENGECPGIETIIELEG